MAPWAALKLIRNTWRPGSDKALAWAEILDPHQTPEGFRVRRGRTVAAGARWTPEDGEGHLLSILRGRASSTSGGRALSFDAGTHLYLPPGWHLALELDAGTELVQVSAPAERAAGAELLIRHEQFVAATAQAGQALRWTLTPQYLSRRVFLRHDKTLRSAGGNPISWFRTTMFDVAGLPANADGEPVFKMSYDSRTEFNVLYHVQGEARVRVAHHPYTADGQVWGPWHPLDEDTTYHLDEAAGGPEEEGYTDAAGRRRTRRNRHEVYVAPGGQASLCCLFDPGPVGIERHLPGAYSDYEPLEVVSQRPEYPAYTEAMTRFDAMVDRLSTARAEGRLDDLRGSPEWALYQSGQRAQRGIELALLAALSAEGLGREAVVEPWTQPPPA